MKALTDETLHEVSAAHRAQLLDISPDVMAELCGLEKVEIINKNKLPFGDFVEYESSLLFDGRPLRFLQRGSTMYLWDNAEEVGGLVEYAYLTELTGQPSHTQVYLTTAIGIRNKRRKKLLKSCDAICRGVAPKVDLTFAKRFVREGQVGYHLAQMQMAELQTPLTDEKAVKAKEKIQRIATKIMYNGRGHIEKAECTTRPEPPVQREVDRIGPSPEVVEIYKAVLEAPGDSEFERLYPVIIPSDVPPPPDHLVCPTTLLDDVIAEQPQEIALQNAPEIVNYDTHQKKGRLKDEKSNSTRVEDVER